MNYIITNHAVERFLERIDPTLTYQEAKECIEIAIECSTLIKKSQYKKYRLVIGDGCKFKLFRYNAPNGDYLRCILVINNKGIIKTVRVKGVTT